MRPALIFFSAAVSLLAWGQYERLSAVSKELTAAQSEVKQQVRANDALAAAIGEQQRALAELVERASRGAKSADLRAEGVLGTLPQKIKEDQQVDHTPEEANRWLDTVFLP